MAEEFPGKYTPSPVEKPYDGESVTNFVGGLTDDLTESRRREVVARANDPRNSTEEREKILEELQEVEVDAIMIRQEEEKAAKQVKSSERHSMTDALTGLPNKLAFEERLRSEVGHINRLGAHNMHEHAHVLFIDLDKFKTINDTYGHDIGDLYLKTAASFMKQELRRDTDLLARIGGDEFTAILFGNRTASAREIAEKMGEAVRNASAAAKEDCHKKGISFSGDAGDISASIGLVAFRENETAESLLKRADVAMYEAKGSGRDRVVIAE